MRRLPEEYLKAPYSRVLIPTESGTLFAEILEFPGCYAEGKTPSEAFNNLEKVAKNWIKAAEESGQSIPEPSTSPGYSGRVVLRLPRSLHRKAALYAERNRSSLNQYFTAAIAARVGAEEFSTQLIESVARSIVRIVSVSRDTVAHNTTRVKVQDLAFSQPGAGTHDLIEVKHGRR